MADPWTVANLIDVEVSKIERWIKAGILRADRSGNNVDIPESEIPVAQMLKAAVDRRVLGDEAMQFLAGYFRSALNRDEQSADEREAIEAARSGEDAFLAIRLIEAPAKPGGYTIERLWQRDRNAAELWLRASDKDERALVLAPVDLVAALKPRKRSL